MNSLAVSAFHFLVMGVAIVASLSHAAPLLLGLTFIPAVIRLALWIVRSWRPLGVHILGISELAQGIVFKRLIDRRISCPVLTLAIPPLIGLT
jgi:hypothetical protein